MPAKRTQADRQRAADIRDWAGANGLSLPERGRFPDAVIAAYDAAMAVPPGEDGPGPDWAAAAAGSVPLDLDEPGPEDREDPPGAAAAESGPAPPAPGPAPGPPPPASLDDARERLAGRGPRVPPWAGSRGGGGSQRPAAAPVKVTPSLTRDIEGKLALLLAIPAATWAAVDPACGQAFSDNLDVITKKAVPLICQSSEAVAFFTKGGVYLLWIDLLLALAPVAQVAYRHHLAGTLTVVNGRPVPARRLADGKVVPADHAPAEPAPDWSAYSTDVPGHVPPVQYAAGQ